MYDRSTAFSGLEPFLHNALPSFVVICSFVVYNFFIRSNKVRENINAVLISEVQFSFHSHSMSGSLSLFSLLQLFFFFGIILISCIGTGSFILQQTAMLTNLNLKLILNQPYPSTCNPLEDTL